MTGSEDRSVSLYNPSRNLMIKNYKNIHNYDVYSLDISKDNSKFISGGGDKNIILTDVIEGKFIRKYTGHTARVNSITFNPDNNVIVTFNSLRSPPATTLQSAAGTTGQTLTTPSKLSKASKIQSHKSSVWARPSSAPVWTAASSFSIFVKVRSPPTSLANPSKDLTLPIAERPMWYLLPIINYGS